MEFALLINGMALGMNILLWVYVFKERLFAAAPKKDAAPEESTPAVNQWANMMSYDGTDQGKAQGGMTNED